MFTKSLKITLIFAFTLSILSAGIALGAESVNYTIDFLGATNDGGGESTWRYAITADGNESNGLSHWTLGLGICATVVAPAEGAYLTPTSGAECTGTYTCEASDYIVEHGNDPTTGVSGIKFEANGSQLSAGNQVTHIFEMTLAGVDAGVVGPTSVAVKAAGTFEVVPIDGPICPIATNVSLVGQGAEAPAANGALVFLALLLVATGTLLTARRRWMD